MSINYMLSLLKRPGNGYDPVPASHSLHYSKSEWASGVDEGLLKNLEDWVGGFKGKRVLDLGAGPGHYSIAFSKRGANVTWHDISARYREIAIQKAKINGVTINFSLGYLDEAANLLECDYDLIFNRICWYYAWDDKSFSKVVYKLLKPGGVAYIDTTHSGWRIESLTIVGRLRTWLNEYLGVKIGHPYPPHGRIARLFSDKPIEKMLIDYSVPTNDRVIFKKAS